MSGRRASARLAGAAERSSAALAPLPLELAVRILASLPLSARLCCAAVSRGWHATLADASIWTRLALLPEDRVLRRVRFDDAKLLGAAARAQGRLEALDVSHFQPQPAEATLRVVVTANAATLRELRMCSGCTSTVKPATVEALLQAAPALRELRADVGCDNVADALRMLRNEPPFGTLRIEVLNVKFDAPSRTLDAMRELAAAAATHASLRTLSLGSAPLGNPLALNAVADALLAHGALRCLELEKCSVDAPCAPALAHIAGSGSPLRTLIVKQLEPPLLDAQAAAVLGGALRGNHTLRALTFTGMALWAEHGGSLAAALLLNALVDHPSLLTLSFDMNWQCDNTALVGAALSALVAANAPALRHLNVMGSGLDDAGLGPLFDALATNTHLCTLDVSYNEMSEALVRDRLLPALRANGDVYLSVDDATPLAREVDALMRQRTRRRWRRTRAAARMPG
jgi:hypothetical protein